MSKLLNLFRHRHNWTKWGMPYIDKLSLGAYQIRQCESCGEINERLIGTYRVVNAWTDLNTQVYH